jgi:hypothetical protein
MSRPRSTQKILHEALSWLGSYPALMRLEADGRPTEEKAELAETAAAMARLHDRLWQQWRRKHRVEKEEEESVSV